MELTKQERRLAEVAAKHYHHMFYRKSELIGWLGLPICLLGILPFFWPRWLAVSFLTVGCVMLVCGAFGSAMSALGKVYQRLQKIELRLRDDDTEG